MSVTEECRSLEHVVASLRGKIQEIEKSREVSIEPNH